MIKAAIAVLGASAISFMAGVYSVPFPTIILGSDGILKNAQIYDVSTVILNAERATVDSNKFYFTRKIFNSYPAINTIDSRNVAITNNLLDSPETVWDTIKYTFISSRPEYYQCTINGIKYKSCDDIPKDILK